jgi:PEP-CTERM motif
MTSRKQFAVVSVMLSIITTFSIQPAHAALVYSLSILAPTSVSPGTNFVATIILEELATAGESTILGDSNFGLINGNFAINRTLGTTVDITGVNGSAGFDTPLSMIFDPTSASVSQTDINPVPTPTGFLVAPNTYRLILGQVGMTKVTMGNTNFALADFDPGVGVDDLVLGDGTVLDGVVSYGSIDITTAPEPTTMGALGVFGAIGAAVSYYRRRKQKLATPTTVA